MGYRTLSDVASRTKSPLQESSKLNARSRVVDAVDMQVDCYRNHSSQPISIPARSRYTSWIKSLVYRCGGGNNAGPALRRSNFDCRT